MKYRYWYALLISLAAMLLASNVGVTHSSFVDGDFSTGNGFQGWTSVPWVQTTQEDFEVGVLTNVSTSLSPGNVILAPDGGAGATDLMLFWDGAGAVPAGWTDVSAAGQPFNNRFPYGAASYGGTGGAATNTHTVTVSSCSEPSATTPVLSGSTNRASATQTHTSATTAAASNLPGYRDLRVMRYSGVPTAIPAGAIAIFDTIPPAGWTRYSAEDDYFVRGASAAGGTGGSDTHVHTVSLSASTIYQGVSTTAPTTTVASNSHTHTSGTTSPADHRPPYITVILAKADSDTPIPAGMIGMFSLTPTGNWSVVSGTGGPFNARFIVGSGSYGATGGASTHTHEGLTITSGNASATGTASTSTPNATAASNTHTHDVTLTFNSRSNLPPYINVIFAKANVSSPGSAGATDLMLFWDGAGAVPAGWTDVSAAGQPFNNRFPYGAASYGGTGGAATNTHTVTVSSCSEPSATTPVLSGSTNRASATQTHTSATTAAASNLPGYRDLRVMRYSGVPTAIPAGAIAIFDTIPPAGWTRYSAEDDYFVRGASAAGGTGGSDTHVHTVSLSASTIYQGVSTTAPTTTVASNSHTHTSGTTSPADHRPPYITVILAKADSDTPIPAGMIGMFSLTPTGNWSVVSGTGGPFNARFIVGGTSYGATGGASTHTHEGLTIISGNASATGTASTSTPNAAAASSTHTHNVTLTFNSRSNLPPYINVIFAKAIYSTSGAIASEVIDTGIAGARWDALFWDETLQASTGIIFEVRASDALFAKDAVNPSWIPVGGASPVTSGLPPGRYKEWRTILATTDVSKTPTLHEVRVYYY